MNIRKPDTLKDFHPESLNNQVIYKRFAGSYKMRKRDWLKLKIKKLLGLKNDR